MKEMRHVQNSPSLPDEILPPLSSPRLLTNSSVWLPQSYFLSLPFESGSCFLQYLRELINAFFFFYNRWIRFAYLRIPLSVSPAHDSRISLTHVYHLHFLSSSPERCLTNVIFKLVSAQRRVLIDFSMCVIVVINISVLIQVSITYFYYSDQSI